MALSESFGQILVAMVGRKGEEVDGCGAWPPDLLSVAVSGGVRFW